MVVMMIKRHSAAVMLNIKSEVMKTEKKMIPVKLIEQNRGQVSGLPKNPRFIRDYRYEMMKKSMEECPEMLELRELIVFPHDEKYVAVCGNQRLRAGRELGMKEMPCKVLPADTPVEKLCEYAAKDNIQFGEDDMDIISNEWDCGMLEGWGFEFPKQKEKEPFRERFEAIKDDDAVYPLIPKYDERHELFIIQSASEVDSNWLRERLGMQKMKSYKTGKLTKSNVIDIKDVRHAIEDSHPKS